MIIGISSGVLETLATEAAKAHPCECCGLLTGSPALIDAVVPARNISPHPETGFEIDPGTLLRAHREARAGQRQVVGHYHSHPNGSAEPSLRDAARAIDNGAVWIVIAAGCGGNRICGWQAVAHDDSALHGRFRPVELRPA